jgi:ribosomal protein S18 acetylase RimI-like enzyme
MADSMFATVALARRIDGAEARLSASLGEVIVSTSPGRAFVEHIAGGVAVYAGPASPVNKMIGVGFEGIPDDEVLARIEERFAERRAPLQAEVSTLADPAFAALLTRRGYELHGFEDVLGRPLRREDGACDDAPGVSIARMKPEEAEQWLDAALTAFSHLDEQGVQPEAFPPREDLERAMRDLTSAPGFIQYFARIDGAIAGTATLRLDEGVAQLCGAATLVPFRRRGVQRTLLRRRLADAVQAGCDLAVMTTQPGSKSQENGHREGFALLYSRALLVKPLGG